MTVGYQGEPGAYSEEAAQALFPDAVTQGFRAFQLVFDALASGAVERAVLPVENTLGGIVQEVNDCLWESPAMRVVGERIHPVRHCLLGRRFISNRLNFPIIFSILTKVFVCISLYIISYYKKIASPIMSKHIF